MRGGRRLRERPLRPLEPRDPRRGLPSGAGERGGSVPAPPAAASALLGRGPASARSLPGQSRPRGSPLAAPPAPRRCGRHPSALAQRRGCSAGPGAPGPRPLPGRSGPRPERSAGRDLMGCEEHEVVAFGD